MATKWGICSVGKISQDFMGALETLPAGDHQRSRKFLYTKEGQKARSDNLQSQINSDSQAVAVAARNLNCAKDFATSHNIPKVYGSYEELAKDPNIDIIYVGALHTVHRDVVLMFMKNGKNVLCEKPLAMNSGEVRELISVAKEHNVFLMEALWSRFFPAYEQIRTLLSQNAIGDVKVVRAEFGYDLQNVQRVVQKELGGGALLDIGCYCIQFALMVFNGEVPQSVTAKGFLYETGVEETVTIILQYSGKRQAILTCTIMTNLPNQAAISGSKGIIQIPAYMWCPTSIIVNGNESKFPVPLPTKTANFPNSTGLSYQAEHVRQCLLKGLKESPIMSWADSQLLANIIEEARKQLALSDTQDTV